MLVTRKIAFFKYLYLVDYTKQFDKVMLVFSTFCETISQMNKTSSKTVDVTKMYDDKFGENLFFEVKSML